MKSEIIENQFPQSSRETAIIDLTIDSKDFTEQNVIHKSEFNKVKDFVKNQIESLKKSSDKEKDFEGFYKSILVEGGRGTGKTTFLKNFFNENIQKELSEVEILSFLDPTRIEDKSSIFLTVIALIKETVRNKFNEKANEAGIECKKKCWRDKLEKLAKGLPSINESPKTPYYWDDDFMIMEKGLSSTISAFNLRENFKLLVKDSLELLGKKAFLLIVDDVDTDCNKAWKLLETIRKYLCIQEFITIVSGNIELFSLEVKQEQRKRFDDAAKINQENAEKQVTELTDQYIRKVFPPEYRVSLSNLSYVKNEKDIFNYNRPHIEIKYDKSLYSKPLKEFIAEILRILGIQNKYQTTAYLDFILTLPIRSQINFYKSFSKILINYEKRETKDSKFFPLEVKEITNLFTEDLIKYNINDELLDERPYIVNSVILKFLTENERNTNWLNDYYQLQPVTLDKNLNSALITLGMVLSTRIYRRPELIFNYMIKIGLVRNVAQIVYNAQRNNNKYNFSLADMLRYSSMTDDIDLRHSMCVMTAYLRSITEKTPGIFEINKDAKNKLFSEKNKLSAGLYLAQLPYSCSRDSLNNKDYYEYSIHALIATVYDIVLAYDSGDDFENILRKNAQPREYLMVSASSENESNTDDNTEEKFLEIQNSVDVEKFRSELQNWLEFSKNLGKFIPPYVLAKVCTRMYYAYSNVKLKDGRSNKDVCDLMQEYILLMFNSIIIEELSEISSEKIMYGKPSFKINRENSIDAFNENIKELIEKVGVQDTPLCEIIITCPFFLFFIDFSSDKNIEEFCKKVATHEGGASRFAFGKFDTEFYSNNSFKLLKNLKIKITKGTGNNTKSSIEEKQTDNENE
ncbi:hypothetical protein [Treponema sp.]|uniref:hypothetical protein n=1 Tax=Treponema sp. TaxID=166 RepID=UPI003F0C4B25